MEHFFGAGILAYCKTKNVSLCERYAVMGLWSSTLVGYSETLEELVIYQDAFAEDKIWARPASMWNETVEVDGKTVLRFMRVAR